MPNLADRQFRKQYRKKHRLDTRIAFLGDGNSPSRVRVPGNPTHVYVQYPASSNNTGGLAWPTVIKMDINLTDDPNTPVVVGYDEEGDLAVLKLSTRAIETVGGSDQHGEISNKINQWVDLNFSPLLRVQPMGTKAPLYLSMLGFPYIDKDGTYHDFRGISGGIDVSSYIPATTNQWRLIMLWLKTDDTHEITSSTAQDLGDPVRAADIQECVDAASIDSIPASVWKLYHGQTSIADTDKYIDLRQWINTPQNAGAGTDTTAVHVDVPGEIAGITQKVTPVSADKLLIEDSADSDNKKYVEIGDLPGGAGTIEYPTRWVGWHEDSLAIAGNALLSVVVTTQFHNLIVYQDTPANNDSFTQSFVIAAGTYTFKALGLTNTNCGKVSWYLDADGTPFISNQDWNASLTYNVVKTGSLVIPTDGYHKITGLVSASSGFYYIQLTKLSIVPSAD